MFKKSLILILAAVWLMSALIPGFSTEKEYVTFSDVPESHYAYNAIMTMKSYGIISGYPDGTFRPDATVSRVEFATMMVNALQLDVDKRASSSFEDMRGSAWAIPFVEAAKPFLTGYKSTTGYRFKPLDPSVREDMAVALIKALNKPLSDVALLNDYADLNAISQNLRPYVAAAVDTGLMIGVTTEGKKYFNPLKNLTRAEAAQMLMNVINEEKITFDVIEDKITFDDDDKEDDDDRYVTPIVKVSADATHKKLIVSWNAIKSGGIQGYKVVASLSDSTPIYPENGYYQWITDLGTTSTVIRSGDSYNGGDIVKFESGKTYYISVTAVYNDKKIAGNTIKITMP